MSTLHCTGLQLQWVAGWWQAAAASTGPGACAPYGGGVCQPMLLPPRQTVSAHARRNPRPPQPAMGLFGRRKAALAAEPAGSGRFEEWQEALLVRVLRQQAGLSWLARRLG